MWNVTQGGLRALKISHVNKMHIFQCIAKLFCVEFQREPLKFHTKYLTHILKDTIFIQHWNFKSSWLRAHKCFWNAPQVTWAAPARDLWVIWWWIPTSSQNKLVNSSPLGQNGRHFPDDIFKCIFMNEKFCILIQISLKFVPRGPINNIPALI